MADFEDANSPDLGQPGRGADQPRRRRPPDDRASRLRRRARSTRSRTRPPSLIVRPRGWHLVEKHIDGRRRAGPRRRSSTSASSSSTTRKRAARARHRARTSTCPRWRATSRRASGTTSSSARRSSSASRAAPIKATVLIETLPAAFEMDEILYELREHSAGLNCGRWDYIFSFIKKRADDPARGPARPRAGHDGQARSCARTSQLLIKTCHRRGVHAMGGMAAQIPIKDDPAANEAALAKVRADKLREVKDGHDGTWVAHPGLVPIAREIFDAHMPGRTSSASSARTCASPPATCCASPRARAPRPACATTSASASSTSRRGCAATAACRSTT